MNLGLETEQTEFKKTTSEMKEAMVSIAAILNKHGEGVLYFGVRNDGEVTGQDVSETTLRQISQAIGTYIEPSIHPTVERLGTEDGKAYVRVVFGGFDTPYSADGRYRIRIADEDVLMSHDEVMRMSSQAFYKTNPWDRLASGIPISSVDENTLRAYIERGYMAKRIPFEFTDAKDVLSRLGLIANDGSLTNAAVVCFVPSQFPMLRMGVLADQARTHILDNRQVTGNLFSLVDNAELYILNNIRREFIIDDTSLHRREKPEIPLSALREALFNAFCHRDYTDDAAVQIDIFWDKVDIYSPGTFAAREDPAAYLNGTTSASRPRNALIAQTLYRSGDIEAYGTGFQRIKTACDEQGTPVDVFQRGHGMHICFTRREGVAADTWSNVGESTGKYGKVREKYGNACSANEIGVLEYIEAHGLASSREIMSATGLSESGVQKMLKRLRKQGIVVRIGQGKSTRYMMAE